MVMAYYPSRVFYSWQSGGIDCLDLVLLIQLLLISAGIWCLQLSWGLFVVPICRWDCKVLAPILNVCNAACRVNVRQKALRNSKEKIACVNG